MMGGGKFTVEQQSPLAVHLQPWESTDCQQNYDLILAVLVTGRSRE
jgi:hypothetical protein